MNPYSKVLSLIGAPDLHSVHQADALFFGLLQLGSELSLSTTGNPVVAVLADMRSRDVNENAIGIVEQRLNALREQLAKGQV